MRHEAGTQLTPYWMITPRRGQREASEILPVDATAHGMGCLPIREGLSNLSQSEHGSAPRCCSGLPARRT